METKIMTPTTIETPTELRQPNPTYLAHRAAFKAAARGRDVGALGIAAFILLRVMFHRDEYGGGGKAFSAEEAALFKLKAAFGPVRNTVKLANGRKPYDTLESLLRRLERSTPPDLDEEQGGAFKLFAGSVLKEHRTTRG